MDIFTKNAGHPQNTKEGWPKPSLFKLVPEFKTGKDYQCLSSKVMPPGALKSSVEVSW